MRTAFSVAVLLGLTYAQYNNRGRSFNPYAPVKPTPTPDDDEDTRPEDCKTKIEMLDGDLKEAEGTCTEQRATLAGLTAMLGAQSTTIGPITEQIYSNQSAIAFSKTNNERQQELIGDDATPLSLQGRIKALETALTDADGLEMMLQMLQSTISTYNSTIESIEMEEAKLAAIMTTVMENSDAIVTLQADASTEGSIAQLQAQATMLEMDYDMTGEDLMTATTASLANEGANTTNQAAIDLLADEIAKLTVTSDYYYQNTDMITFMNFSGLVEDDAMFCVPDGIYFEFYANLATSPDSISQITKFQLSDSTATVLATSEVPEEVDSVGNSRNRDHAILYKGVGDGSALNINYGAVIGQDIMATADVMGFQWGVKLWTAAFNGFTVDDPNRIC